MPPSFKTPVQTSRKEEVMVQSFVLFPVEGEPIDPITVEEIKEGLKESSVYKTLIQALENNTEPPTIPYLDARELKLEDELIIRTSIPKKIKGRVFKPKPQILLPESLVNTALR